MPSSKRRAPCHAGEIREHFLRGTLAMTSAESDIARTIRSSGSVQTPPSTGGRTRKARQGLTELGFTKIWILDGQMFQWVMNQYPVGVLMEFEAMFDLIVDRRTRLRAGIARE